MESFFLCSSNKMQLKRFSSGDSHIFLAQLLKNIFLEFQNVTCLMDSFETILRLFDKKKKPEVIYKSCPNIRHSKLPL